MFFGRKNGKNICEKTDGCISHEEMYISDGGYILITRNGII